MALKPRVAAPVPAMKAVLVTGANGFVGSALCPALAARGYRVMGAVRSRAQIRDQARTIACGDIDGATDWCGHLQGIDVIVHLAARTQVDGGDAARCALRRINVDGAEHLARQAAAAGVQRFVFVSSIKVNGETTHQHAFRADDTPAPQDAYAVSKRDAEQRLWDVAAGTGLELVSIRPPLVYGPGVAGNFLRMLHLVDRGLPLPLARVNNLRSLVAIDNLVDFLVQCVHHPAAAGRTLMVSDGEDLSTPQLLRLIAAAMNRRPRLWPAPLSILRVMARATGHGGTWQRLCGSLAVDIGASCYALGWRPSVSVEDAVSRCVEWYLATGGARS